MQKIKRLNGYKFIKIKPFKTNQQNKWIRYPIVGISGAIIMGFLFIWGFGQNLPSLVELERASDPMLVTRIYSANGVLLEELGKERRIKVPLAQIPESMIQATIAMEDRRFWDHYGLDLKRAVKAIIVDVAAMRKKQGASTLTQMLARHVYLSLKKTWVRKLREQLTAIQIERTYTKNEILEMYLNQMPFGRGAHGVQMASRRYFGKNVEDLLIEESALLAGMLQLPYGYYSPDSSLEAALRRRNLVLQSMAVCNYITPEECDSLKQLALVVADRYQPREINAPYFCEYVRLELKKKYGQGLYTDGLTIETTLDTRVQACADSAINSFLPEFENQYREQVIENRSFAKWLDPPIEDPDSIEALLADTTLIDSLMDAKFTAQVALIAMNPKNGHILAMVGGRDFQKSKWNRAVQMQRQPGSAFKPFVYTVAIDNGYPPTLELLNQPIVRAMADGTEWRPGNITLQTGGLVTLRNALKSSENLVSARLVQEVITPREVVNYAKLFGFTTNIHPYDAIALGSDVVIPIELTTAYCVFANEGVRVEPMLVTTIRDKDGNVIEEFTPKQHDVLTKETAYVMTDMLNTAINKGTGASARWRYKFYRTAAAGKTGTTNDYRNAWYVGFTPNIAAGVWVGFDDERITLGENRTGGNTALPIWAPFMRMVHDSLKYPHEEFHQPLGVVRLQVCAETKRIATSNCPKIWDEVFIKDTEPTDTCEKHLGPGGERSTRKRKNIVF